MRVPWPGLSPEPSITPDLIWEDFTRYLAPRGRVRLDVRTASGGWAHRYDREVAVGARPPEGPFAVYLADATGFRFVVFDLDAGRGGRAGVRRDVRRLCGLLDEVGLVFLVVASGPGGGHHVWVPVNDPSGRGLGARLVRDIARSARVRCPSLDISALLNPRTGCVRPPGAAHRHGGRARLLSPVFPDVAAAYCGAANRIAKFEALAERLGPAPPEVPVAPARAVDARAGRLVGRRRPLPGQVEELLAAVPADASAHLARILTALALARWSQAEVAALVREHPGAPGLEHLRTQGQGPGRPRRRRTAAEQRALVQRQWARVLAFAARLPRRAPGHDAPGVRALVDQVARIEAATLAGSWWTPHAGPSDRKALLYVAAMALRALTDTVEVDCRRVADAAGMTPSTASRALRRLVRDGRLELALAGEGRRAHTYRLVSVQAWPLPGRAAHGQGGTQAVPAPEPVSPGALLERLEARLEHAAHDVWARARGAGQGLGRHVESTAAAADGADLTVQDVDQIAARTGYTRSTTLAHLRVLTHVGLIDPVSGRYRPHPRARDALARARSTHGIRARRMRRYRAERRAWHAWCRELDLLRAPLATPRTPAPRYPRTASGHPDHRTARAHAMATA
ncbi:hypothetical protein HUT17_04975 (plasmid) [Nocardiopsis flavescens]|nr:hypothetical protein HUT17_04975 [Nocardiopsis flavescens]